MSNSQRKNEAIWIEARQRWQINVQRELERKTFTSKAPGKKGKIEAERKADKWLVEPYEYESIRFNSLYDLFLAEVKKTTGTSNYNHHEQAGRLWLKPTLGHRKVSRITLQQMQDCVNGPAEKGLSVRTCTMVRASLSALYTFARRNRINMERPEGLKISKKATKKQRRILSPKDLSTLFAQDKMMLPPDHTRSRTAKYVHAWRLMVVTGMRRGEAAALKWKDIHDGVIHIQRSLNSTDEITGGKTDSAVRALALGKYSQKILDDQRAYLKRVGIISKWVFPNEYGEPDANAIYREWQSYRKQNSIECSLHELRHTMISIAKADVPEELIKPMVGHTVKMDTLGVYGHEIDGEKERAAQLLDQALNRYIK